MQPMDLSSYVNYLDIAGLDPQIIELMKEPEKRSETVKELLKGSQLLGAEKTLTVEKAANLSTATRVKIKFTVKEN